MKLRCVLFDLDGTLLPMDQEEFTKAYFHQLAKKLAPRGYEPTALIDAVWSGTAAMVKNDGQRSNEEAFWQRFEQIYGPKVREEKPVFEDFYANEFQLAQSVCGFTPPARDCCRNPLNGIPGGAGDQPHFSLRGYGEPYSLGRP